MSGALDYQLNGSKSEPKPNRALLQTTNTDPLDFLETAYMMLDGKARKNECLTLVQSFADESLDPNNPDDIKTAHEAGIRLAMEAYPGCLFSVVTQNDGKKGFLHNHIIVPNINLDTGLAIRDNKLWSQLKKVNDQIMKDMNLDVCNQPESGYDFESDFVSRLEAAYEEADDYDMFKETCAENMIVLLDKKKNGTDKAHITYEFEDPAGTTHKMRDYRIKSDISFDKKSLELSFKKRLNKVAQAPQVDVDVQTPVNTTIEPPKYPDSVISFIQRYKDKFQPEPYTFAGDATQHDMGNIMMDIYNHDRFGDYSKFYSAINNLMSDQNKQYIHSYQNMEAAVDNIRHPAFNDRDFNNV